MLIKKNLKKKEFAPCLIISKLKKQSFALYPACKKQNQYQMASPPVCSFLSPKIEELLLKSLSCGFNIKRQVQKKKKTLHFLYPVSSFHFQKKGKISQRFFTHVTIFTLLHSKKGNRKYNSFALPLENPQLKIVLKSYNSQSKDIETSITAISKLIHYLNSCCVKQFKKFLINSFYLASFGFYSSFFSRLVKTKDVNNSSYFYPGNFSTFSLQDNDKNAFGFSSQRKQKALATQMPLHLNLLIEQPLIQILKNSCKVVFTPKVLGKAQGAKKQKKDQSAFLLSALQKTNYCNRYFFKLPAFLENSGPINKQVQKTSNSTQLFTVIRSPFIFKKTREQFIKQSFSYNIKIELHSPIQKQLFVQCLSLLRLPVQLEVHC